MSGLPGAKGDIVQNAGSAQAWVKTDGTSNTAWQTFPGSSGSTYTPGAGIGIDGGVISNTAPVSDDYAIPKANSSSADVNAAEVITSLTTNTAGSENSKQIVKTLLSGTPTTSLTIAGNGIGLQAGSAAAPAISFAGTTMGMWSNASANSVRFGSNGGLATELNPNTLTFMQASGAPSSTGNIIANANVIEFSTNRLRIYCNDNACDVMLSNGNQLSNGATGGFFGIPTMANGSSPGTPSGPFAGISRCVFVQGSGTAAKLMCYDNSVSAWHTLNFGS